jgi:glycosyltransferase involved in cell wall biosynthesis
MRICVIGKYPPIEGGVSARNFWVSRLLAERGHQVCVVTNAPEVEMEFRMHFRDHDRESLEYANPESGGWVKLFGTPLVSKRHRYIPWANPFVSKLAALACETIREHNCEVIYSYYFEPYAVAAHLAARWTGVPYIVKHAGSDLGRLIQLPDLRTTYQEVVKAADLVATHPSTVDRFLDMGVAEEKLFTELRYAVPQSFFHPAAEPMDIAGLIESFEQPDSSGDLLAKRGVPFDVSIPTIGIYGKVGETKGSYDLVRAMGRLAREGLRFNLLAMVHGWSFREAQFRQAVLEEGLTAKTWLLPFVPPWHVPSFIRRCTAICFLERDFPISLHAPTVPREVQACGTCLVVSLEVARKQIFRERLMQGVNAIIIRDPRNTDELATHLRSILTTPERAQQIGKAGHDLSQSIEDPNAFISSYEKMLRGAIEPLTAGASVSRMDKAAELVRAHLPWTSVLLATHLGASVEAFLRLKDIPSMRDSDIPAFAEFLQTYASDDADTMPYFREVVRYETKCTQGKPAESGHDPQTDEILFRTEGLEGADAATLDIELKPYVFPNISMESFDYDIESALKYLEKSEIPPIVAQQRSVVLFQRDTHSGATQAYRINSASADIIPLLDGTSSISSVGRHLADYYHLNGSDDNDFLATIKVFLADLLKAGIVGLRR